MKQVIPCIIWDLPPLDLWMAHLQPYISEGLQKYLAGRTFHRHKPKSIKSLKTMILNESPHNDSRKLSLHFLWSTQWHILTVLLWASKELAQRGISRSWSINFWQNSMDPRNTPNFKVSKGFQNGLNAKFQL